MSLRHHVKTLLTSSLALILAASLTPATASLADTPPPPARPEHEDRYIVIAKSPAEYDHLRNQALQSGARVVEDIRGIKTFVVEGPAAVRSQLAASPSAQAVARDHVVHLIQPNLAVEFGYNASPGRQRIDLGRGGGHNSVTPDPAFGLPGLMWNVNRINAPRAWQTTTGDPAILVGVADTGLDYTHSELASQVTGVVDFTATEDPPICKTFVDPPFNLSDADWSALYGGPADGDWNGHGSWIGGNIAGALDGVGINGIAPTVKLVALKISQWCGSAYDSELLASFQYAADHGIDIVSISFGGYLDRSDPDQDAIYQAYVDVVKYAAQKGTVIVAAAGNEHVRLGAGGRVLSHGQLTIPGDPLDDLFGLWEVPGGVPGVVAVSATGNMVNGPSASCPAGTTGSNATCKPASDAHQPTGVGRENQLTYYSNYGPRIDVAAPGGARKFNVPAADRGGTPGWPVTTADGTTAWEAFSITSNWALEIPCYFNLGPEFYPDECYSTIQGTSMATPHASAALALIASARPALRHHVRALINALKDNARELEGNTTPPLSASDTSPADRTGAACPTAYCHLGGRAISSEEAYGAGLVDVSKLARSR